MIEFFIMYKRMNLKNSIISKLLENVPINGSSVAFSFHNGRYKTRTKRKAEIIANRQTR